MTARTTDGHRAAMVLACPPTAEDESRLEALVAMPGLVGAEWTTTPGSDSR